MGEDSGHTFVILAYKESPYLEECILSLKKQTVKSKIIISTSTPSSFLNRISEKHRVPLIINNSGSGIASDWSFAYNNCTTKYLTLAHQDDLYLPEYTESCLYAANKQDNNLITFTGYKELIGSRISSCSLNLFVKKIVLMVFLFKQTIQLSFIKKSILAFGSSIACPSVMYNKGYIGFFEFSKEFYCNLDWDAWIRLSRAKGSFTYVKKKLMIHRIHKDSQTSLQIKNKIRKKEDEIMFKKIWHQPVAKIFSNISYIASKSGRLN